MNLRQVIVDAIKLADEHSPKTGGEVMSNYHDRQAAYVIEAIERATGISLRDAPVAPDYARLEIPSPRVGPMFG